MNDFIKAIKEGKNIFLTGGAGVGKSYTLESIRNIDRIAFTASTGIAAMNIEGVTIHSFCGMGTYTNKDDLTHIIRQKNFYKVKELIRWIKIVVIDEISMIAADQLDLIDAIFKACRKSNLPFGGVQMIFVGDFLQLPPVISEDERKNKMGENYWAFDSDSWRQANIQVIHLTEVKRQNNLDFINALNNIRLGYVGPLSYNLLAQCSERDLGPETTVLMSRNKDVDDYNQKRLNALETEFITLKGAFSYNPKIVDEKERGRLYHHFQMNCRAQEVINLKVGARVIVLKNNPEIGVVNGSTGTVMDYYHGIDMSSRLTKYDFADVRLDNRAIQYSKDMHYLSVLRFNKSDLEKIGVEFPDWNVKEVIRLKLDDGRMVDIERAKFTIKSGKYINEETEEIQEDATFWQFPLALAWAISIHKSQGMTLNKVFINLNGVFAPAQTYVALSRATSPDSLAIKGWSSQRVFANKRAVDYYRDLTNHRGEV